MTATTNQLTPDAPPTTRRAHMPALDGLRGIAVLMIIWHHGVQGRIERLPRPGDFDRWVVAAGGGLWTGVDLFFALSGFLITGILLDTRAASNRWTAFVARRALRILPVYLLYVTAVLVALPAAGFHPATGVTGWAKLPYFLQIQNLAMATNGLPDYTVSHLWSLAVEEQFYLLWPLLVFALPTGALGRTMAAMVAFSAVFRWWAAGAGLGVVFIHVHIAARFDALCLGAMVALWARNPGAVPKPARAVLGTPGAPELLAGTGLAWMALTDMYPFHWGPARAAWAYLAIAATAACLVAVAARTLAAEEGAAGKVEGPVGPVRWLCGLRPLRFVGRHSYAMYIFHTALDQASLHWFWSTKLPRKLPVFKWSPVAVHGVALALASLAAAVISWHLLEKHCLAAKRWFPYRLREPQGKGGAAA